MPINGININYVALHSAQGDELSGLEGMTECTDHLHPEPWQPEAFILRDSEALPDRKALTGSPPNLVLKSSVGPVYRFMSPECQFYTTASTQALFL